LILFNESKRLDAEARSAVHELLGILRKGKDTTTQKELDEFTVHNMYPKIDPYTDKLI